MLVSSRAVPAPFSESDDGHRQDGAGLILLFLTQMQSYDIGFLRDSITNSIFFLDRSEAYLPQISSSLLTTRQCGAHTVGADMGQMSIVCFLERKWEPDSHPATKNVLREESSLSL